MYDAVGSDVGYTCVPHRGLNMKVFMLGWEFPPFISGGLGTACYGLTKAMDQMGIHVTFVLPKSVQSQYATHVNLLNPTSKGTSSSYKIDELKEKHSDSKLIIGPGCAIDPKVSEDNLHAIKERL